MSEFFKEFNKNIGKNVLMFRNKKMSLNVFSKEEILLLHKNRQFGSYFDGLILAQNIAELKKIFENKELQDLLITSKSFQFRNTLLKEMFDNYPLYRNELLKVLNVIDSYYYNEFLEELLVISKKDLEFKKFITPEVYYYYLIIFSKESPKIWRDVLNSYEIMQYFFSHFNKIENYFIPKYLKKCRESIYYEKLLLEYKEDIYMSFLLNKESDKIKKKYNVLASVLEDLLNILKVNLDDLEYFMCGSFVTSFKINDMVLKFGKAHSIYEITSSPNLLYPIFRYQIEDIKYYIEISPLCEIDNITLEDVYKIYKEERERGNFWLDPKIENLGRLLKRNNSFFIKSKPEMIGFNGKFEEFKEKGELIIIDLDFLWKSEDIDWEKMENITDNGVYLPYEKRYQEELKLKRKEK